VGAFLRDNLVWIVLSVLLSIALWVVVNFQQNPEITNTLADVPVAPPTNGPPTMIVQLETTSVQLTVSAPRDVWPQLTKDSFRVAVDASKVTSGVESVTPTVAASDPRAHVIAVSPPQVQLRVEPRATKQVPVQVVTHGSAPFGYNPGPATTTPAQVTVTGPQTSVDQVQTAVVEVSLDGVTKTIDETASPIPEAAGGTPVDRVTVTPEVLVEIPIQQTETYKVLPVAPNLQGQVAPGYLLQTVQVDPETVQLVGDPAVLGQMQVVPTQPISVDGLSADRDVSTSLALPSTVAMTQQQAIVVHLHIQVINGSEVISISPRLANDNSQYTYQITPQALNVTVSGPVTALSQIQPQDIQAIVDVQNMKPGMTQSVAPLMSPMPAGVTLVNVQPPTVTVSVR
jgi:YbbR domain-containing protein